MRHIHPTYATVMAVLGKWPTGRELEVIQIISFMLMVLISVFTAIASDDRKILVFGTATCLLLFVDITALTMWVHTVLFTFRWLREKWSWTYKLMMRDVFMIQTMFCMSLMWTCSYAISTTILPPVVAFAAMILLMYLVMIVFYAEIISRQSPAPIHVQYRYTGDDADEALFGDGDNDITNEPIVNTGRNID